LTIKTHVLGWIFVLPISWVFCGASSNEFWEKVTFASQSCALSGRDMVKVPESIIAIENVEGFGAILKAEIEVQPKGTRQLPIGITLKNTGTEDFQIKKVYPIPKVGIQVINSHGELCKLSEVGKSILSPWSTDEKATTCAGSMRYINIKPGEKHDWNLDIRELFVIKPGKYQARIMMDVRVLNGRSYKKVYGATVFFDVSE